MTEYNFRCKVCQDGIAREKLRAVKGKDGNLSRQLLHPRCFFDWLRVQLWGNHVAQVNYFQFNLDIILDIHIHQVFDYRALQVNDGPWQFHNFLEANGSQGLRGFNDLRAEEQAEVEQLVAEHIASVTGVAVGGVNGPGVAVGGVNGPGVAVGDDNGPVPGDAVGGVNRLGDAVDVVNGPGVPSPLRGPVLVISSGSEDDDDNQPPAKAPRVQTKKKDALPTPGRKMPNMLEGVKIPEGVERTGDECSVRGGFLFLKGTTLSGI